MKKNQKIHNIRIYVVLLLLMICIVLFRGTNVYAQGSSVSATLPVEQVFLLEGQQVSESQTVFQYELRPGGAATPMPIGTRGGVYTVEVTGTDTIIPTAVIYDSPGTYTYTFKAALGNDTTGYIPSNEEYQIEVYVETQPDGTLSAIVVAKNGEGVKVSALGFTYLIDAASGSGGGSGSDGSGTDNGDTGNQGSGNNTKSGNVNTGDIEVLYILKGLIAMTCVVIVEIFGKKRLDFYRRA